MLFIDRRTLHILGLITKDSEKHERLDMNKRFHDFESLCNVKFG
jgi:hypothetical protein